MPRTHEHQFQRLSDEAIFCACGEIRRVEEHHCHHCHHGPYWWYYPTYTVPSGPPNWWYYPTYTVPSGPPTYVYSTGDRLIGNGDTITITTTETVS